MICVQCQWCDRLMSGSEAGHGGYFVLSVCAECWESVMSCPIGPTPPRDDGKDDVWRDVGGES